MFAQRNTFSQFQSPGQNYFEIRNCFLRSPVSQHIRQACRQELPEERNIPRLSREQVNWTENEKLRIYCTKQKLIYPNRIMNGSPDQIDTG